MCVGKEESLILEVNVKLGFKYMDPLFQNSSRYFSKGVISTWFSQVREPVILTTFRNYGKNVLEKMTEDDPAEFGNLFQSNLFLFEKHIAKCQKFSTTSLLTKWFA